MVIRNSTVWFYKYKLSDERVSLERNASWREKCEDERELSSEIFAEEEARRVKEEKDFQKRRLSININRETNYENDDDGPYIDDLVEDCIYDCTDGKVEAVNEVNED